MTSEVPPLTEGRSVRSVVPRVLRRGAVLVALIVIVEYFVVPRLVVASHHLDLLGQMRPGWLVAGTVLEAASLFCYALLTRTLLPHERPRLSRLVRIMLATTALEHVVPAGAVAGPSLTVQLLHTEGVAPADAAFLVVTEATGSAVVLNVMLWIALLVSIPLVGVRPVYLVVALLGLVAMLLVAALIYTFTRGEERAVRVVRWLGDHVPRVGADRLERGVRRVGESVTHLGRSRAVLWRATLWAALNWLLDAASLWAFVAAFGYAPRPVEVFVAYGVAYVLAVIPVVPAGLGVVEATTLSLLVGFGVPPAIATFGVLGWRLVNFWLPIPVGAAAYLSLRLPPVRRRR
ncbi:MAG: lysylphosphatidylglycerol synthase transmembrane domain-containing protein [Blastococcus sp.]